MSDAAQDTTPESAPRAAEECLPCRGTGRVISQLGASPSEVSCPWCGGSGMRRRGIDAQEAWASAKHPPADAAKTGALAPRDGAQQDAPA